MLLNISLLLMTTRKTKKSRLAARRERIDIRYLGLLDTQETEKVVTMFAMSLGMVNSLLSVIQASVSYKKSYLNPEYNKILQKARVRIIFIGIR